jgi:hypothetical protein
MKTETEIRMEGMRALIGTLGLIEAERFLIAVSRDRFDYTEWRRHNLSQLSVEQFALAANKLAEQLNAEQQH